MWNVCAFNAGNDSYFKCIRCLPCFCEIGASKGSKKCPFVSLCALLLRFRLTWGLGLLVEAAALGTTGCVCCSDGVLALTADPTWCSSSIGNSKALGLHQSIVEELLKKEQLFLFGFFFFWKSVLKRLLCWPKSLCNVCVVKNQTWYIEISLSWHVIIC